MDALLGAGAGGDPKRDRREMIKSKLLFFEDEVRQSLSRQHHESLLRSIM
jgi:hypothetical protein